MRNEHLVLFLFPLLPTKSLQKQKLLIGKGFCKNRTEYFKINCCTYPTHILSKSKSNPYPTYVPHTSDERKIFIVPFSKLNKPLSLEILSFSFSFHHAVQAAVCLPVCLYFRHFQESNRLTLHTSLLWFLVFVLGISILNSQFSILI